MRNQLGLVAAALVVGAVSCSEPAEQDERPRVEADGTVHVPAFDLPETSYLSEESRAAMKHFREVYGPEFGTFSEGCASLNDVAGDLDAVRAARQCVAEGYYETAIYRDTVAKHPVEITAETIAGVYTEVFVPKRGVAEENANRLLISIHGGGFRVGARYFSHTEAMQVADMGGYKVISPDYRMAPEFTHPAGVEDVIAVYKAMLEDYEAAAIGIYGCSAGAMLTAQTVAYMLENDLPLPGAIGLFCAGIPTTDGDTPGGLQDGPQRERLPGVGDQRLSAPGRARGAAPAERLLPRRGSGRPRGRSRRPRRATRPLPACAAHQRHPRLRPGRRAGEPQQAGQPRRRGGPARLGGSGARDLRVQPPPARVGRSAPRDRAVLRPASVAVGSCAIPLLSLRARGRKPAMGMHQYSRFALPEKGGQP